MSPAPLPIANDHRQPWFQVKHKFIRLRVTQLNSQTQSPSDQAVSPSDLPLGSNDMALSSFQRRASSKQSIWIWNVPQRSGSDLWGWMSSRKNGLFESVFSLLRWLSPASSHAGAFSICGWSPFYFAACCGTAKGGSCQMLCCLSQVSLISRRNKEEGRKGREKEGKSRGRDGR